MSVGTSAWFGGSVANNTGGSVSAAPTPATLVWPWGGLPAEHDGVDGGYPLGLSDGLACGEPNFVPVFRVACAQVPLI